MKRRCSFLQLLFLFLFSIIAHAQNVEPHALIRVGFFEFAGYHEIASNGTRTGYGYDFLQKLARYTDWNYEYIGYHKSWNEMQQMLADGTIDILTSAQKTPDREASFLFSQKPIGTSEAILTAKSGNTRFIPEQYNTYNGMRVGMLKGSSRNANFESFAKEHSFTYTPVYFESIDSMIKALHQTDTVDTLLTSNLRAIKDEWILNLFAPSAFYVMVRKDNTALLAKIDNAISQLDTYDPAWRQNLWNIYYSSDSGEEIAFSAKERAFINSAKKNGTVFTALLNPDRAPYSYFVNGEAKGIIPELFKEIERRTGLSFKILTTSDRKTYWDKIKEGRTNIRIDTYFNYYEAEVSKYKLTDPYLTTSISCLTKKTFTGTPHSIAALRYADRTIPYQQVVASAMHTGYYNSVQECVNAVLNGTVDATYLYTYTAQKIINDDIRSKLNATIYPQYLVSFAVGVSSKDDSTLLTILNKAVNSLPKQYTEQVIIKQTSKQDQTATFISFIILHPLAGFLLLAIIIIISVIFIMKQKNMKMLETKNRELALAIETADKANQAKSRFLSRMSHEMRTPMNAIVGITTIAKNHTTEPERIYDYLNKIDSSSHLLLGIINDVLDMSAIENNKITIVHEPFSLKRTFTAINTMYDVQCRNKGITFTFDDLTNLDIVIGDQLRLNQVLLNLISNAYKFTDAGGAITLRAETIRRSDNTDAAKKNACIQFTVADTGCGMNDDMIKRLFQPFEQENNDIAQRYGGSGLGLAITKNLIDLMQGTISVNSKKQQGTTFTVAICFETIANESTSDASISSKSNLLTTENYDFTGKHFLLAEDNELNREIAVELLTNVNAKVDTAVNGKEAVRLFKDSAPGTYDIILMDMQMPELNGIEATKQIRTLNHPQAATIPILAMTANAYKEDIELCNKAGMNGHLAKPIEPLLLYSTISTLIHLS